jgi:RecG-like helicase
MNKVELNKQLNEIPEKCRQLIETENKLKQAEDKRDLAAKNEKRAYAKVKSMRMYFHNNPDMVYNKRCREHKNELKNVYYVQKELNEKANELLNTEAFDQAIDSKLKKYSNKLESMQNSKKAKQKVKNQLALKTAKFILSKCEKPNIDDEQEF